MALPIPLPDNPMRWNGWKLYSSSNPYERLCLEFADNPGDEQIEANFRQILMWWQKKLPLKNQPSNPLAQLLRSGMDEAPAKLAEARTLLLDPKIRAQIDADLLAREKSAALAEFNKFLSFVLTSNELDPEEEENLYHLGDGLGLNREEMRRLVDEELALSGVKRAMPAPDVAVETPVARPAPAPVSSAAAPVDARTEFLRMLRLSELDDVTDDQRDAFCNMGEALGLSGGDAEDVIDEYLEERMNAGLTGQPAHPERSPRPATPPAPRVPLQPKNVAPEHKPAEASALFGNSPQQRAEERSLFPDFTSSTGISMLLVPSGSFLMGSADPEAAPNEQPPSKTNLTAFYLSRWPVTNAQYEKFDPAHRSKRALGAGDAHPVVYVTHADATRFCDWLSAREKRKYRLPTEAEWEYAARSTNQRKFPWGNLLKSADLANFADANKRLPWADPNLNGGFAETSPVGSFPHGASPFGMEDMAGNVWEWCLDCFSIYPGKERANPRGPLGGLQQIYRGGSWKSRVGSLRTSTRNFNAPAYSANDVGFRIACETGK